VVVTKHKHKRELIGCTWVIAVGNRVQWHSWQTVWSLLWRETKLYKLFFQRRGSSTLTAVWRRPEQLESTTVSGKNIMNSKKLNLKLWPIPVTWRTILCVVLLTYSSPAWIDPKATLMIGRAMSQVVSRRPLTAEAQVRAWVNPCGICGGQSGTGTGFYPSSSAFPCQYIIPPSLSKLISSGECVIC
jgi:hypothetical protein